MSNLLVEGPGGLPQIKLQGSYNSKLPVTTTGVGTFGSLVVTGGTTFNAATLTNRVPVAANATATLTAAQVASGYITSTSAAATTLTMPTGTLLGAALGAVAGSTFELYIDNTAGANTVTMAVATNGILNALAGVATYGVPTFGLLTVPSGVTGQARYTIVFSSATAYTFARTF